MISLLPNGTGTRRGEASLLDELCPAPRDLGRGRGDSSNPTELQAVFFLPAPAVVLSEEQDPEDDKGGGDEWRDAGQFGLVDL